MNFNLGRGKAAFWTEHFAQSALFGSRSSQCFSKLFRTHAMAECLDAV
jgi:hypothetical protein